MKRSIFIIAIVVIMALSLAMGCESQNIDQLNSYDTQEKNTPKATDVTDDKSTEEATDTQEEKSNIIGEVLTTNTIENQEGNYIIPITDDWIGKVSYVLNGKEAIIYHITKDKNELEVNPILLHINIAQAGEDIDGDVVLEIGNFVHYSIPRLDFPYNEGTDDANEFASLYESIPIILQNFWLIDDSAWQEKLNGIFNEMDTNIVGLYIGQSKESAIDNVGQPTSTEQVTFEATGEVRDILTFDFGTLEFSEMGLVSITIENDSRRGPRELRVGAPFDEVVQAFSMDTELSNDDMTIFYRANTSSESNINVPPYGVLHKGDTKTLVYSCFADENDAKDMSMEDLEQNCMFMEQYSLVFSFDENDIMTSFSIYLAAPSE